jgi:hypothetical protein
VQSGNQKSRNRTSTDGNKSALIKKSFAKNVTISLSKFTEGSAAKTIDHTSDDQRRTNDVIPDKESTIHCERMKSYNFQTLTGNSGIFKTLSL